MKISEYHQYRTFSICKGATTADTSVVNPNTNNGEYNQLFYGLYGAGVATAHTTVVQLKARELIDLSHLKGQEITYISESAMSAWVAFNPLLPDTELNVSIIADAMTINVYDPNFEIYIVPINGFVTVNNKVINEFESGRLLKGKEAILEVPASSICALVKTVKLN